MNEPSREPFIGLRSIPGIVRRMTGETKNPHIQTVRRWYIKGVKGITLQVVYVGGNVFTTETMLQTFFDEIARARSEVKPRTRSQTQQNETYAAINRRARQSQIRLIERLTT